MILPSIWFLTPSELTVAVEPAAQVDQWRRPFRVPTVLVAASYLCKTYVACGAVQQVSWPSLNPVKAERRNQKPFAAANLSSFPLVFSRGRSWESQWPESPGRDPIRHARVTPPLTGPGEGTITVATHRPG